MTAQTPTSQPPRTSLRWLPIAAAIMLSACSGLGPNAAGTASKATTAVQIPDQWTQAQANPQQAATALAAWWDRFSDPQLTALITQALHSNTTVRSAQAALAQAKALANAQQAGLGPALAGSGSAQRSQSGANSASNRFQLGFDASWEPDIFGRNRNAASASDADEQASAANLANIEVSLAAEVAANYINLRSLQSRLLIAQKNLSSQEETLQIARWRAQAGLASSLDVEQSLGAVAQTRAQLPALLSSAAQTQNALAVLTGQAPGSLNAALSKAAPIPQAPDGLALAFPAQTLRQRPDVRAAESRIDAALARLAVADAARYPSIKLGGSLSLSAMTLGTLTDGASLLRALLTSVSLPLYDGGARDAQVRAQEAALAQAQANYQGSVLTALQDVEDALAGLKGDAERLGQLQAAQRAAASAELLARQRFQSGLIDFATLLTAQRALLSAQDSVASAQSSLGTQHVKLYKALGGGWQPTPSPTTGARQ